MLKSRLRKKILKIRKLRNKKNIQIKFDKIFQLIKSQNKVIKFIGGYFPVNYEVDDLNILREFIKRKFQISLPVIKKRFEMNFYKWSFNEPLKVNNLVFYHIY